MISASLDAYLGRYCASGGPRQVQIAETVRLLADAAVELRRASQDGPLSAAFAGSSGTANEDGDAQKDLDLFADNLFLGAARRAGLDYYASEELKAPVVLGNASGLALAVDPLDGSSNIDANVSIGTIFSILPSAGDADATFLQPGCQQLAAGFFIYGPQLALALTLGDGARLFVFLPAQDSFVEMPSNVVIAPDTREFAINASNYRHWDEAVRVYIDDCLQGAEGPASKNYNMRWIASLVAESYRILVRGGVFLYPGDSRKGYRRGRLRLVYEVNPIALLIEQAGGAATDGMKRVLEIEPTDLHQRTPFIFGSVREVEKIARYYADPSALGARDPLFGHRGLLRV